MTPVGNASASSWGSDWRAQFIAMVRLRVRLFAANTSALVPFFASPMVYCLVILLISRPSGNPAGAGGDLWAGAQPEPVPFEALVPSIPSFVGGGSAAPSSTLLDAVNSTINAHRIALGSSLRLPNYWHRANSLSDISALSTSFLSFYGSAKDFNKPESIPFMGGFMLHSAPPATSPTTSGAVPLNFSLVVNANPEMPWGVTTPVIMLNAVHDSIQRILPPGRPDPAMLLLPKGTSDNATAMFVIERLMGLFSNSSSLVTRPLSEAVMPVPPPWSVQLNGTQSAFRLQQSEVSSNGGQATVLPPLVVLAVYFFLLPTARNMVADRVDGHLAYFFTNGVDPSVFYLSSVAAHICLAIAAVISMFTLLMGIPWLSIPVTLVLLVFFAVVVVLQASTLSFVFASKDAVPSVMYLVIVFASAGPQFISSLLSAVAPSTIMTPLNLLLPSFSVNRCLTEMAIANTTPSGNDNALGRYHPFAPDSTFLMTLGVLLAHAVLYSAATVYLAHRASRSTSAWSFSAALACLLGQRKSRDDSNPCFERPSAALDPSVVAEKERIRSGADADNDVVRIQGLGMSFGTPGTASHVPVLDDLWFTVRRNEVFAFLGPNGAGKSTTIKILTGLLQPTRGSATVCGKPSSDPATKRLIGVCPQYDYAYGHLTVRDHLQTFAAVKGVAKDDMEAAIDQVVSDAMLEDYLYRRVDQLSGGTRRRMSIAIACLGDPAVVILDEPTTGVDLATRRTVWDMILRLKQRTACLLISHDLDEADRLSERAGIMINGSLVCLGTPRRLKSLFGTGYLLKLQFAHRGHGQERGNNAGAMTHVLSALQSYLAQDAKQARVVYWGESSMDVAIDAFGPSAEAHGGSAWLGQLLTFVVTQSDEWGVSDWSLGELTLDELFTTLAKQHRAYQAEEGW